ncbi:pyridoxal phosphate-dependent aminotransferase [Mycoplasma sp. P36-A1]|uniref:pyridoxal phosphate-dependent aminotransferase n=1 Tax=Mycoplasma sp. P36-A1 TaxID=3252900 RepID=UPI003C2E2CAB
MRNDLKKLSKYKPAPNSLINLAQNENYFLNWQEYLSDQELLAIRDLNFGFYGNNYHDELVSEYAKIYNIDKNMICPSAGSDSMIGMVFSALTLNKIAAFEVDFFRYEEAALIAQRELKTINNNASAEKIASFIDDNNIELFILSNPNNPQSTLKSKEYIVDLLNSTSAYIVLDEAYVEYASVDCLDLLSQYDNLLILRTLSKAWGLAALRIGFVLANEKLLDFVDTVKGPFTLSDVNSLIASKALKHIDHFKTKRSELIVIRDDFKQFLKKFEQFDVYDSETNFVYFTFDKAEHLHAYLKDNNIIVSKFNNGLRITIGTTELMNITKETINKYFSNC